MSGSANYSGYAEIMQQFHNVSSTCFEDCVGMKEEKVSENEKICLGNCFKKYMDYTSKVLGRTNEFILERHIESDWPPGADHEFGKY